MPFQKGQSGNAGGRPKGAGELKERARGYTEAALVGVPTVASPTQAYAYAVHNGENGLLAATADEWRQALTLLIEQPDLRKQVGEAARRAVRTGRPW